MYGDISGPFHDYFQYITSTQHWCYYSENVDIMRETVAALRSEMNKSVNVSFILDIMAQLNSTKASRQV